MITNNKPYLSNEELNELVGGVSRGMSGDDITNLNTSYCCICTYYDSGAIINDNQADECWCQCLFIC